MKTILCILSLAAFIGCQSTPKAVAFVALSDTARTVDAAMRVYGKACAAGKVSAAKQASVDAIHEKYRVSIGAAIRLARHDWNAPVPDSVVLVVRELLGSLQQLNL